MSTWSQSVCAVSLALAFGCGAAHAEQIVFQGLSGSSTRHDVQIRFPKALLSRGLGCHLGETFETVTGPDGSQEWDCDHLRLTDYEVAGLKFTIDFTFEGTSHRLLYVNLVDWWADIDEADNAKRLSKSQVMSQYEKLHTILISSHGMPYAGPYKSICKSDEGLQFSLCDEWQGMPTELPDESLGKISLEAAAFRRDGSDPTFGGYFQISYVLKPQFKEL